MMGKLQYNYDFPILKAHSLAKRAHDEINKTDRIRRGDCVFTNRAKNHHLHNGCCKA